MIRSRRFELQYSVHTDEISRTHAEVHLWVPFPRATPHQDIHAVSVETSLEYEILFDSTYGNSILHARLDPKQTDKFSLKVITEATRFERATQWHNRQVQALPQNLVHFTPQLKANDRIKFTSEIIEIAQSISEGKNGDTLKIARAAYDYVIDNMEYDKTGDGWGEGDTVYACSAGKGNCTDFHSLFLAILRVCGIPGQFEIGAAFPFGASEGDITFFKCGYHCWTSFYVHGLGWVPADCSEAAQKPGLRDYYFGSLDENRFLMSYGRDILLPMSPTKQPQNFFTDPVLENEDGTPLYYEKKLSFRTL